MCMSTVQFALEYDKGCRDFVGIGYKKVTETKSTNKKWQEAKGGWGSKSSSLKTSEKTGPHNKQYIPGFHIFLNKNNAETYGGGGSCIVKVKYRGVLAFGKNETGGGYGDCIIASHMKVVEVYNGEDD